MGLPADCGTVTWKNPTRSGNVTYTVGPSVSDAGVLYYTVYRGDKSSTGTIKAVAETQNYNDMTFTINIKFTEKACVKLKTGSSVTLINNTLTYGQKLSTLQFNDSAVFVYSSDTSESPIEGTLAWKHPDSIPAAGTTSAVWVFTPRESGNYESLEGFVAITMEKASIEGAEITLGPSSGSF